VSELRTVAIHDIHPSLNARGKVGDVAELALSLRVLGLMKPLLVMPRAAGGFEILDGHRRHAAAVKAGIARVEVVIRSDLGEAERLQAQLAMETHAKGFDPMAEARALHTLMFNHNLSREQISRTVGRTPGWVRDRVALVHLTAAEQSQVSAGKLSLAHALFTLSQRRAERDGQPAPKPPSWNDGRGATPAQHGVRTVTAKAAPPATCGGHCRVHCPDADR
jgi:ParB family chromosome partitioning protein